MKLLDRLNSADPLVTVELRPPRMEQQSSKTMDEWLGLNATVQGLLSRDTVLFLTDGAVGTNEEENLHHLVTNLADDVSRQRVCPFLTTKHTLEYCLWYADRAVEAGCGGLTVLGGDKGLGAPRCVPHGYLLREQIRQRHPELPLGGWANPHRDAAQQVDFLSARGFNADFYLTQLVSHLDPEPVERFLAELDRRGIDFPAVFGVFYYRSANVKTLRRLAKFFPVPVDAVIDEFNSGLKPTDVCAKTVRWLHSLGVSRVYVSNFSADRAAAQLARVVRASHGAQRRPESLPAQA